MRLAAPGTGLARPGFAPQPALARPSVLCRSGGGQKAEGIYFDYEEVEPGAVTNPKLLELGAPPLAWCRRRCCPPPLARRRARHPACSSLTTHHLPRSLPSHREAALHRILLGAERAQGGN